MRKDCVFQYATPHYIVENTGLITRDEADALYKKYMPTFIRDTEAGLDPEMCIWIDMKDDCSYDKSVGHIYGQDCIVKDGVLFVPAQR